MFLKVIGSSSNGNTLALVGKNETLILDCGCKLKETKIALDFNISNIVGAVVSHEHG